MHMLTFDMLLHLCCPACRSTGLQAEITEKEGELFVEGHLLCDACQVSYPVQARVPDLIPHDAPSNNEWQMWRNYLEVISAKEYSSKWFTPNRLLISLGPKGAVAT